MADEEVKVNKDDLVLKAIFNPHNTLQFENSIPQKNKVTECSQYVSEELRQLEIDAVNAAQNDDLINSMNLFNKLVNEAPQYASAYNNRAQLFRIQGDNESAFDDLNKAILLSNGQGRAASLAFVQRGLLYKLRKEDGKALEDFNSASKLGNLFAKSQITAMNPYAALCNQMLGEVFSRICNGEPDLA